ncbi:aromatic ring-hydroxylating dioxygenase subunit alpha [Sphingobium sp. HBC34]|uniref:Aromatic ring-hydroxylating dioxygenase subunit alpha n=1 Tax=Sphingobium cyanobacteriorum TaxID=3063954 RepID=A0ABT8ZHR6_9SPHN|nr:aromatic ring-hydroxylating dioxygenase subunit alpha [Sphingobium sp. HBC34]MDO7833971.1 aromatic ring-hydroxylating dioxygenase subunit alpha [Sphingobium sp. HBC34]
MADPDAGWSLPAWTYSDPEFFAVERARIFRPAWQIVAHESDIPNPGDFQTLDYIGESVIVLRGDDGAVRAFTNVCRHRGARIVDGTSGCAHKLVCPYHGWTYETDGRLSGVPMKASYGDGFALADHGLSPVAVENWQGFLFVRLADDGGPSVAEMMAPHAAEIAPYRFADLRALGRVTLRPRAVNWKIIGDNYSDGLHITVAHPGLKRLMGDGYGVAASPHADRMWGPIVERPSPNLSERAYQHFLPPVPHLPPERQRLWTYYKLWPNFAFDIYPDQVDFMAWLPVSPTQTLIREISYALPDARREMRAARYLNWRINRQVNAEDTDLVARVQAGMASQSFTVGPLSEQEVALRHFCGRVRDVIPQARLHHAPGTGWSKV